MARKRGRGRVRREGGEVQGSELNCNGSVSSKGNRRVDALCLFAMRIVCAATGMLRKVLFAHS